MICFGTIIVVLALHTVNDFHHCSEFFDFHLFADDANCFAEIKALLRCTKILMMK